MDPPIEISSRSKWTPFSKFRTRYVMGPSLRGVCLAWNVIAGSTHKRRKSKFRSSLLKGNPHLAYLVQLFVLTLILIDQLAQITRGTLFLFYIYSNSGRVPHDLNRNYHEGPVLCPSPLFIGSLNKCSMQPNPNPIRILLRVTKIIGSQLAILVLLNEVIYSFELLPWVNFQVGPQFKVYLIFTCNVT